MMMTYVCMYLSSWQGEPEEVAREKCLLAVKEVGGPTMVEDTALCFNALGGLPGVYVKWFLEVREGNYFHQPTQIFTSLIMDPSMFMDGRLYLFLFLFFFSSENRS